MQESLEKTSKLGFWVFFVFFLWITEASYVNVLSFLNL